MDKASFSSVIGKLYVYFRFSKLPNDAQIDMWFNDCQFIPLVAVDWIFDQFKQGDTVPRNLPKEFIKLWYSYRKAHPDKTMSEFEHCEDCSGHGIHIFQKLEDMYYPPRWISCVAMCASCNNWKKEFGVVVRYGGKLHIEGKPIGGYVPKVPRVTKQEIIDLGFRYMPLSDPKAKRVTGELPKVELSEIANEPQTYQGPRPENYGDEIPF